MVPTIQTRVVQQSFRNSRVSARGTRPGTSTLLGGACSTPTAHWFLLVGGGCRCVMTSITRIGITSPDAPTAQPLPTATGLPPPEPRTAAHSPTYYPFRPRRKGRRRAHAHARPKRD